MVCDGCKVDAKWRMCSECKAAKIEVKAESPAIDSLAMFQFQRQAVLASNPLGD